MAEMLESSPSNRRNTGDSISESTPIPFIRVDSDMQSLNNDGFPVFNSKSVEIFNLLSKITECFVQFHVD